MKVLVLTAGLGTRLRPHTFSRPKPLVSVAGKPMLAHILDTLLTLPIDELIFITGYLGNQIERFVKANYDVPSRFIEQTELLGQAHAIYLAREVLSGPTMVVFGDGIFAADLDKLSKAPQEGVIYVQEVEDPRRFGVAVVEQGRITRLVEKPTTPVSNLAVIGVYYVPEARRLIDAITEVMERNIQLKGEYYLADALQVMIDHGETFRTEPVSVWADCGTVAALLQTNRYLLDHGRTYHNGNVRESVIIPPVHIADNAVIEHSVIGPYVSIAAGAKVRDSRIRDSIINEEALIQSATLQNSLIGEKAVVEGSYQELNIGDTSELRLR